MDKNVKKAVEVLNQGGIVIFPTDTVFGIGCRVDDKKAVEKLFKIKRKLQESVAPVLVGSTEMAQQYLKPIPKDVFQKLIKPYWPGGLTIVLPGISGKVSARLQSSDGTLGVRMPDHTTVLKIIKSIGIPIVGSSANFYGDKAPYKFSEIDKKLIALVDFVLVGRCGQKVPSTIIDCSKKPWKILRQGAVKLDL